MLSDSAAFEETASEDRNGMGDLSRKESDELYKRLQENYDELLTKYAQAENTIDQLRIGAKLNLYSDLPPPQQSTFVSVPRERQPQAFTFPRSHRASFDRLGSQNGDVERSSGRDNVQSYNNGSGNPFSDRVDSSTLTPGAQADSLKAGLISQLQTFQEDVDTLQNHIMEGQLNETELREMQGLCDELKGQHAQMLDDLAEVQRLETGEESSPLGREGSNTEFLPEGSLDGQLYRLGLRLEEISEQISDGLMHHSPSSLESQDVRRDYNDVLNRPRADSQNLPGEQKNDHELNNLVERLKRIKEANRGNDLQSRNGNSLEDLRGVNTNQGDDSYRRRFSLGSLPNDSLEKKSPFDRLPSGADLGESGYFASETMSVNNDPVSEPLSSQYLANSRASRHPNSPMGSYNDHSPDMDPRERAWSGSLLEARQRRPSRQSSVRSRSNTRDASVPPDGDDSAPSSPDCPSPNVSPRDGLKTPRGSTSPGRSFSQDYPTPRRQDSRLSEASLRSRAGSNLSRIPRPSVTDSHDVTQDPRHSIPRDRSFSTQSTPRSAAAEDVFDTNPRAFSKGPPKQHQRRSVSGESRVSTPLFQPHHGGARPKEFNARGGRGKVRPATAETERGFDSGFFGSEGSRISRGNESPDIPHSYYRESKSQGRVPVRENSVSESEDGQYSVASSKLPKSGSKYKDPRRRRSYLQSLSESEEDRSMVTNPPKSSSRVPSGQRERRSHRHTPTHPAVRSDAEGSRRLDDSLRRYSSSPNLNDASAGRSTRTPSRHDSAKRSLDADISQRSGPRSEQSGRPTDKQSVRSHSGMDRESLRSRRTRRDGYDSSSGYSEGDRKHRRDPTEGLRAELQRLRTRLEDEASVRTAQGQLYDDLRRRYDDLEREVARRNAEQQLSGMYDNLRKKYDDLARELGRRTQEPPQVNPSPQMYEDLRSRLENLAREVDAVRKRDEERPRAIPVTPSGTVRFLCPFCGGFGVHSHGEYFYPGYADPGVSPPGPVHHVTPRSFHTSATQTAHTSGPSGVRIRHQTTPVSTSVPFHYAVSSPVHHHHTQTYPGTTGSPTVHHIHHLPGSTHARHTADADSEESSSEEELSRVRRRPVRRHPRYSRRSRGSQYEDEFDGSDRLHQSLDEANRAARQMQKLSKRMLSSITTDILRSTKSR